MLKLLGAASVVGGGLWAGITYGVANKDVRILALGGVAVACNVAMYAAPLSAISRAIKDDDPTVIPALLTVANTFLSACWLVYGLLVGNWFVAGPNVAGTLLCLAQLAATGYVSYRVATHPELQEKLLNLQQAEEGNSGKSGRPSRGFDGDADADSELDTSGLLK